MGTIDPDAPSVINGKVVRTSVSAMQKGDECDRQYYYRYVLRLPEGDPGKGATRGTAGHRRLYTYLSTGTDILDPLERLGIDRGILPTSGPGLLLEYPIEGFGFAEDLPMLGSIDLVNLRELETEGRIDIGDYKFKKSIADYGTRDAELIDPLNPAGIQMLGYAAAVVRMYPQARELRLAHFTFQTKGRKDLAVTESTIKVETVSPLWYQITSRIVPKLKAAAAAGSESEVPQTGLKTGLCDKYRGCPYKTRCHDKTQKILAAFKKVSSTSMGKLDRFTAPATPSAPAAPVAQNTIAPSAPVASSGMTARQAEQTKRYLIDGKACTFMVGVSGRGGDTRYSFIVDGVTAPLLVAGDTPITPLTGDAPPVLATVLPPDAPVSNPAAFSKPVESAPEVVPSTPQNAPQMVAALTASLEAEKPKATRKKRDLVKGEPLVPVEVVREMAKAEKETQPTAPVSSVSMAAAVAKAELASYELAKLESANGVEPSSGVYLYFGCSPLGIATQTLVKYVNEIDKSVRENAQLTCADIRATNSQDYGFGKWKAYFVAIAVGSPPPPGHYVVTAGDERVEVVASALQEVASLVVRS